VSTSVYDVGKGLGPDDGHVKAQLQKQAAHALKMAERQKELPPLSEEQLEREHFQADSNAMAEANPRYAAARAASSFLVVPLDGTTPLVKPSDATRDPWQLFLWWDRWPEANPGILLGRVGGLFALRVEDNDAWERFKNMAAVPRRDPDTDRTYTEWRDLNAAQVHLLAPDRPFSVRYRGGWGREFERAAAELARESRNRNPETFWLVCRIRAFRAAWMPSTTALAPSRKESAFSERARLCPGLARSLRMAFG
jgi:hypothetical protein